jgi:hypothetical protein
MKMAVSWDLALYCLVEVNLMMETASTSETSVNFYQTIRRINQEDGHLRLLSCLQNPAL